MIEHKLGLRKLTGGLTLLALMVLTLTGCDQMSALEKKELAGMSKGVIAVADALEKYKEKFSAYPTTLDELVKPPEGKYFIKANVLKPRGYEWEYGHFFEDFDLRLNPTANTGFFYYTDKSKVVRYRRNMIASGINKPVPQ